MSDRYETVEVPFRTVGNRRCLTRLQLENEPWLKDFFDRFRHCFELDGYYDVYWFYPDGK